MNSKWSRGRKMRRKVPRIKQSNKNLTTLRGALKVHIVYKYTKQHWASGRSICYLLSVCLLQQIRFDFQIPRFTSALAYIFKLYGKPCVPKHEPQFHWLCMSSHVLVCVCWPFANTQFNTAAGLFTFYNWHGCCCAFFFLLYIASSCIYTQSAGKLCWSFSSSVYKVGCTSRNGTK